MILAKKLRYQENHETSNYEKNIPKNINQYRHIIEDKKSQESDILWIQELRNNKIANQYQSLKGQVGEYPDIYRKSFDKYKSKIEKERNHRKNDNQSPKGNLQEYEHLIKQRIGLQPNSAQLGFETTLRKFNYKPTYQNIPWTTLSGSLDVKCYLSPTKHGSIQNLEKIKNFVSRPYECIYENHKLNGNEIKSRKFVPSKSYTSKNFGEHYSSVLYSLKYPVKNVNAIRHLLSKGNNNSLTLWEADLRTYSPRKINNNK